MKLSAEVSEGIFALLWVAYTAWWVLNTWVVNKHFSKPLQKILAFYLIFKSLHSISSSLSIMTCKPNTLCYWSLATTSAVTIYNTFLFTNLVLISKGFGFIKSILDRAEITFIAVTMGIVYLAFSVYTIKKFILIYFVIVVVVVLFAFVLKFTRSSLKRLAQMRAQNIIAGNQPMAQVTEWKLRIYRGFFAITVVFFIGKMAYLFESCMQMIYFEGDVEMETEVEGFNESCELITMAGISWMFRAADRGVLFEIGHELVEIELRRVVKFYKAKTPEGFEKEISCDTPFLMITPRGKSSNNYKDFLVANPIEANK